MSSAASMLKTQFDFQTRLFKNVTAGISDHESQVRQAAHVNNIKWIAGHMLNTRLDIMSKLAGLQPDNAYGVQFGRGAVLDLDAAYPSMEEISAKWNIVSPEISDGISKMSAEMLSSKAPVQSPIADIDDTVGGMISFLLSHEALHIGQLSILRKMTGKESMSFR